MRFIKHICFLFIFLLIPLSVDAAKPSGLGGPEIKPEVFEFQNPVEKAQEILKSLGFYDGPIDGRVNRDLNQAIENYENAHGLRPNGEVTQALLDHLENIGRVKALLQRLELVRERKKREARRALLANPKTKAILEADDTQQADPTRDKMACFKDPNSGCLLEEAVESSRAVFEDDLRDWALGEILAAQVRAGMPDEAIKTASRIKDTRLVVAALATIAITQAQEGQIEEAYSSIDLIPLLDRKISVLLEIAKIQTEMGAFDQAFETISDVQQEAEKIDDPEERFATQINILKIKSKLDNEKAVAGLNTVMNNIRNELNADAKVILLRQSASAMADFRNPDFALQTLNDLPDDDTRIPVLMSAARAFLAMERFQAAENTLDQIAQERYRSVIMSDLALALWQNNQPTQAQDNLEVAIDLAHNINLPFAKNFALSRAAQTMSRLTSITGEKEHALWAYEILNDISDNRIKARGLWDLAHVLNDKNIEINVEGGIQQAVNQAFDKIPSRFSRAWLLGELASKHILNQENDKAKQALTMALDVASGLKNPWARARVFAKLGAVLSRLD